MRSETTVSEQVRHDASAAPMRLGFWVPVYGNWIVSKHPETQNASFDYSRKLTLLAEDIGVTTFLLQFHPMLEEMARFDEQVVSLLAKAGMWVHPTTVSTLN